MSNYFPESYPWGRVNTHPKPGAAVERPVHSKVQIKGCTSFSASGNTHFDPLLAWPSCNLVISNKGLCSRTHTLGQSQMLVTPKFEEMGRWKKKKKNSFREETWLQAMYKNILEEHIQVLNVLCNDLLLKSSSLSTNAIIGSHIEAILSSVHTYIYPSS